MEPPGTIPPDPRPPPDWKVQADQAMGGQQNFEQMGSMAVASGTPVETGLFMEGMLKKRGDFTKSWRERGFTLRYDQELGYILGYVECETYDDGTTGPKEGAKEKILIVRGANLNAKPQGNEKDAIGKERMHLVIFFAEGPGGRTGDKIHMLLCESDEEKKEWEGYLKKAREKAIKWSGKAAMGQKAKNAYRSFTDGMMGTMTKAFHRSMRQKENKQRHEISKSIRDFFK